MEYPSQKILLKTFEYREGHLYWRFTKGKQNKCSLAECKNTRGYKTTKLNYIAYRTHRLIFIMFHGFVPKIIDHIDRNTSNNNIENLRECTQSQNLGNTKRNKRNKSGVKGVFFDSCRKEWIATGTTEHCKNSSRRIGRFKTKEEAIKAREKFVKIAFGDFYFEDSN